MHFSKRSEKEVLLELKELCQSSGYIHALSYICFEDNLIFYSEKLQENDVHEFNNPDNLNRQEISTLICFMCQDCIDYSLPCSVDFHRYVEKTYELLSELHGVLVAPMFEKMMESVSSVSDTPDFLKHGSSIREAVFYSGDGAYKFQYLDLIKKKYVNDDEWFVDNKGYDVNSAVTICNAIDAVIDDNFSKIRTMPPDAEDHSFCLSLFSFSLESVACKAGLSVDLVGKFIDSFLLSANVSDINFNAVSDFNPINAYPILNGREGLYVLFQPYSLAEALYETPFFWFLDANRKVASKHRGEFLEKICFERLQSVFGEGRVFKGVGIFKGNQAVSDIDVLVLFASRAIVLQAKAKKLTVTARQGNELAIQKDFKAAIQDAYDQAEVCAKCLIDASQFTFKLNDGTEINVGDNIEEIYPLCVVSDHYPALFLQVDQFLDYKEINKIAKPFVMDVFLLDTMAEMLDSPLYFLSYIDRRVRYNKRIYSSHELQILGHHLVNNLWFDEENSFVIVDESCAAQVDVAMLARRAGIDGKKTPDGILTKFTGMPSGKIIKSIENKCDSGALDFGFALLEASEETILAINSKIAWLAKKFRSDGMHHDFSMVFSGGASGVTVHINAMENQEAAIKLQVHCTLKKYQNKSKKWHGILVDPVSLDYKLIIGINGDWCYDKQLDGAVRAISSAQHYEKVGEKSYKAKALKIGRNDPCLCGSGKKYKKCCLLGVN